MHQPRHLFAFLTAAAVFGMPLQATLAQEEIPESRLLNPSQSQQNDQPAGQNEPTDVPTKPTDAQQPGSSSAEQRQSAGARQQRAMLEVQLKPADRGVTVTAVRPGGAADQAGIRQGDTLVEIDGKRISQPQEVASVLDPMKVGEEVIVKVLRNGEVQEISVTLAAAPVEWAESEPGRREQISRRRMAFDRSETAPQQSRQSADNEPPLRIEGGWLGVAVEVGGEDIKGLRVTRVFPGGPAARAGITKGSILLEIEGKLLSRHEDLAEALHGTEPGQVVSILVTRGPDPTLNRRTRLVQLGESQGRRIREIDEADPNRESVAYWEDSQGFAAEIPAAAYELEYRRRMAEQNERLERLLISLREEIQSLREEVSALKADRLGASPSEPPAAPTSPDAPTTQDIPSTDIPSATEDQ